MKTVEFIRDYRGYAAGTRAGFGPKEAERLEAQGYVKIVSKPVPEANASEQHGGETKDMKPASTGKRYQTKGTKTQAKG